LDFRYYEIAPIKSSVDDLDTELHRHLFYELFFFYGGSGTHIIDFREFDLSFHCIQIVSPHQLHQVIQSSDSKGYVIKVNPVMISSNPLLNNFFNLIQYNKHFNIGVKISQEEEVILRQSCLYLSKYNPNNEESVFALLSFISLFISIIKKHQEVSRGDNSLGNDLFTEFLMHVEKNFLLEKSTDFYTEQMHISLNILNNTVKERTGMSVKKFLIQRVLLEAKRLIAHSNKSVKEIAYDLEFLEPAHFTNFFKKHTGHTPSGFRINYYEGKTI
jgi:AraC family transcriptional regulator, transcriptional activator of pobA